VIQPKCRSNADTWRRPVACQQDVVGRSRPTSTAVSAAQQRWCGSVQERAGRSPDNAGRRSEEIQRRARRTTSSRGLDRVPRTRARRLPQVAQERRKTV